MTGRLKVWDADAGAWKYVDAAAETQLIQSGKFTASNSSAGPYFGNTLTFPIPFKAGTIPVVVCTILQSANLWYAYIGTVGAPTNVDVAIYLARRDGAAGTTTADVYWIAIGERA